MILMITIIMIVHSFVVSFDSMQIYIYWIVVVRRITNAARKSEDKSCQKLMSLVSKSYFPQWP